MHVKRETAIWTLSMARAGCQTAATCRTGSRRRTVLPSSEVQARNSSWPALGTSTSISAWSIAESSARQLLTVVPRTRSVEACSKRVSLTIASVFDACSLTTRTALPRMPAHDAAPYTRA
jgi:hypothetical protein